jgi:hypothetical protein
MLHLQLSECALLLFPNFSVCAIQINALVRVCLKAPRPTFPHLHQTAAVPLH